MIDELRPRRVARKRRRHPVHVRGLMKRAVVVGDPRDSLTRGAAQMRAHRVGALAILDERGSIVGIITERDLMRALADGRSPSEAHISEYMTQEPITIEASLHADKAAALMTAHGVRHLPVTEDGRLVGFLSVRDLLALHPWPKPVAEPW